MDYHVCDQTSFDTNHYFQVSTFNQTIICQFDTVNDNNLIDSLENINNFLKYKKKNQNWLL